MIQKRTQYKQTTPELVIKTNSTCIVCDEIITHTVPMRRYCRGSDCKKIFYKLKECFKKKEIWFLTNEEKKLYNKFIKKGTFEDNIHKKIEDKPFMV